MHISFYNSQKLKMQFWFHTRKKKKQRNTVFISSNTKYSNFQRIALIAITPTIMLINGVHSLHAVYMHV